MTGTASARPPIEPQEPETTSLKPTSPYRVLQVDLPFYSDPECRNQVPNARLILLISEDPVEPLKVPEALPTTKRYRPGQIVQWGLSNKRLWEECWYRDPEDGRVKRAWTRSVEFTGKVYMP